MMEMPALSRCDVLLRVDVDESEWLRCSLELEIDAGEGGGGGGGGLRQR
jgi:hypothetical protein